MHSVRGNDCIAYSRIHFEFRIVATWKWNVTCWLTNQCRRRRKTKQKGNFDSIYNQFSNSNSFRYIVRSARMSTRFDRGQIFGIEIVIHATEMTVCVAFIVGVSGDWRNCISIWSAMHRQMYIDQSVFMCLHVHLFTNWLTVWVSIYLLFNDLTNDDRLKVRECSAKHFHWLLFFLPLSRCIKRVQSVKFSLQLFIIHSNCL